VYVFQGDRYLIFPTSQDFWWALYVCVTCAIN
jgi:hypothetical protein